MGSVFPIYFFIYYIYGSLLIFRKLWFAKRLSFLENQPPFFGVGHPQKGDTLPFLFIGEIEWNVDLLSQIK